LNFINEYYGNVKKGGDCFWIFDIQKDDFFLKSKQANKKLTASSYQITIEDSSIWIPYNFFIMIGDYDKGLDCVIPDEIMGRKFNAIVLSNTLDESTYQIKEMKVTDYRHTMIYDMPFVNTVFPVMLSDSSVIMISQNDMYNKLKNMTIGKLI